MDVKRFQEIARDDDRQVVQDCLLPSQSAAMFSSLLVTCLLDEDAPHGFRCRREEMSAAVPVLRFVGVHHP
jgi:hypothetical protein